MSHGRILGIDHGIKRIGVAISDPSQLLARELTIIQRTSKIEDFAKLNAIITEQDVIAVVIGIPNNDHIDEGVYSQADTVKLWAQRFAATMDRPLLFWDEQLSSHDAREIAVRQKRKSTDPLDDLAARVILQSYLDALRDGLAPSPIPSDDNQP